VVYKVISDLSLLRLLRPYCGLRRKA